MAFAALNTTVNNWGSTLDGQVLIGDLTIDVADASLLTAPCYLTIWDAVAYPDDPFDDGGMEIVYVTLIVGNTLTVTRGSDPRFPAAAHADGESVQMLTVAQLFHEVFAEVERKLYNDQNDVTTGRVGINVATPVAMIDADQSDASGAIPVLQLDQADESEGFINFVGSDRGFISGATSSLESVRVEVNGVVRRIAVYADA
jgi:hypothetical protein